MKRFRLTTVPLYLHCPYLQQQQALSVCHLAARNQNDTFCYGCDVIEDITRQQGLRTFRRIAVEDTGQPEVQRYYYAPIREDGTEWLVFDAITGERYHLAEYQRMRASSGMPVVKSALKLVAFGAATDDTARAALSKASQVRHNYRLGDLEPKKRKSNKK